jgi:hypothetical protein
LKEAENNKMLLMTIMMIEKIRIWRMEEIMEVNYEHSTVENRSR